MTILIAVSKEKDHEFQNYPVLKRNILETTFCHPFPLPQV